MTWILGWDTKSTGGPSAATAKSIVTWRTTYEFMPLATSCNGTTGKERWRWRGGERGRKRGSGKTGKVEEKETILQQQTVDNTPTLAIRSRPGLCDEQTAILGPKDCCVLNEGKYSSKPRRVRSLVQRSHDRSGEQETSAIVKMTTTTHENSWVGQLLCGAVWAIIVQQVGYLARNFMLVVLHGTAETE